MSIEGGRYRQQLRPKGRPSQQGQQKAWKTSSRPGRSYRCRDSERSTVCGWSKGARTGPPPSEATAPKTIVKQYNGGIRQCEAILHQDCEDENRRNQHVTPSKYGATRDRKYFPPAQRKLGQIRNTVPEKSRLQSGNSTGNRKC